MTQEPIQLHVENGLGTLTLNRPESLNAMSVEMESRLTDLSLQIECNPDIRCLLITAAGDHFMAGGDVKGFHKSITEGRERHLASMEQRVVNGHLALHKFRRMAKPVIVAVQGVAAGFGVGLTLAADIAIASEDASFVAAYGRIGLTADGGLSYFLPRIVGERRALQFVLTGEPVTAGTALEWGMVNWVVPQSDLQARAQTIAQSLADGPTAALGEVKQLMRTSLDTNWDSQSAREGESIARIMATDDHLEGLIALTERRAPVFKGR